MLASCSSTRPITATSNPVGNKCGEASTTRILGLGGSDNIGINRAAKDGGITRISHVDYSTFSFLGLYTKMTTRVYGE
ncbi:MAG: TRL domain-containing protein [Bacteroidales bacterium]|nr:TRL domain-containing protein [Bacteroidales bacterium]